MLAIEDVRLAVHSSVIPEDSEKIGGPLTAIIPELVLGLGLSSDETQEEEDEIFIYKSKSRKKVILSDDEDENNIKNYNKLNSDGESDNSDELNKNHLMRHRLLHLEDSDNEFAFDHKSTDLDSGSLARRKFEKNVEQEDQSEVPPKYKYKIDIFDTETSDDELGYRSPSRPRSSLENSDGENFIEHRLILQKKLKKSLSKKSKAASLMEKKKEKLEIFSESQKRIRESEICLPYHKPKQRSLSEFLNRKKTVFASSGDMRRSLKMSMKDENLLREIEERKKDVATFYKADSDENDIGMYYTQKEAEEEMDVKDFKESVEEKNASVDLPKENKNCQVEVINKAEKEIIFEPNDVPNKCNLMCYRPIENILQKAENEISQDALNSVNLSSCTENDSASKSDVSNKQIDYLTLNNELTSNKEGDVVSDLSMCLETSACREILFNSNDDTESFRLHIDMDDTEEADLGHQNTNLSLELKKAISNSNDNNARSCGNLTDNNNSITPKMHSLASRYPKLDLSKVSAITPKIGTFIDMDDEESEFKTPKLVEGASRLIDRFVQHSNTKRKPTDAYTISLNIVTKEKNSNGEMKLVSSDILVDVNPGEAVEDSYKEPVPGACLVLLKSSLKAQLLQQREKERQRREKEKKFTDSEEFIQDYNDGLPDEEKELTDGSETEYETESEPEEDDVVIKDIKRKKNKFLDEEAQESAEDDDDDDISDNDLDENDNQSETSRMELNEDSNNSCNPRSTVKNISRKIIDDVEDYSNINVAYENEDSEGEPLTLRWGKSINMDSLTSLTHHTVSMTSTEDLFISQMEHNFGKKGSMDASFELMGSLIPGHQPGGGNEEPKKNDSFLEDDTSALSMFSRLDNLRKYNSSDYSEFRKQKQSLNLLLTPLKGSQFASDNGSPAKKSLAINLPQMDGMENQQSQELLRLCSGQFTTQDAETEANKVSTLYLDDGYPPTQDINNLVGLCSDQFTTLKSQNSTSGEVNMKRVGDLCVDDEFPPTQDINDLVGLCSGQFTTQRGLFPSQGFGIANTVSWERNSLNAELEKSSSLKNVRELDSGSCSPTDSPVDDTVQPHMGSKSEIFLTNKPHIEIYSSDEEGILQRRNKKHKRKRKRIMVMSDDEGAASDDSLDSITDDDIEYDEDERPIVEDKFFGFKDVVKGGIRSDFLDKEAELSGSEEGSEDEEEPDEDNDVMEQEAGDLDHFNEEELRNEIGKAHLKSVIDSDKRELKLLQEMYLEDGDLHGQGRQRKFRWQHLNSTEDAEGRKSDDEEIENEEVSNEEIEWRKQRAEKEKFIRDQKAQKNGSSPEKVAENATEPAIFPSRKLGRTVSCKATPLVSSNSFPLQNTSLPIHNLSSSSKRGSFLRRDTSTLKKIAELAKENQTIGGAKQGGNFVFHSLTAEEIEKKTKEVEKRKSNLEKPQPKKCRLERSFFSMDAGSQNLSIFKHL